MNAIDELFGHLRAEGRKAFIPFITAGDPDLAGTVRLVGELARRGASLIEIGLPYSDPIADGPVIQASYTRALARGVRLEGILEAVRSLHSSVERGSIGCPLVCMGSYSLIHRRGPEPFVAQAQAAGFSGAIVPDLPVEEAEELAAIAKKRDFKLIQLIAPTTPRDRARRIAASSTGFLYYVSLAGITGERDKLPDELLSQLAWLREQTDLPICVGFGISRPEQVRMLRDVVDGVIVGSAFVRRLESISATPFDEIVAEIGVLAQSLAQALNPHA